MINIEAKIKKHESLMNTKRLYYRVWDDVNIYFNQRKKGYFSSRSEGSFFNEELFTSIGVLSLENATSSILGMLWPNGGSTLEVAPPKTLKDPTKDELAFYNYMQEYVIDVFDEPEAGFEEALESLVYDCLSLGTEGILPEEGDFDEPEIVFRSLGVEDICIEDDYKEKVRAVYWSMEMSIDEAIEAFGENKLSQDVQNKIKLGDTSDKIEILIVHEPRGKRNPSKKDKSNKAYSILYIEKAAKHLIKEDGSDEFRPVIHRFKKRKKESYGTSPAINCLSDLRKLDKLEEDTEVIREKLKEPPLGVYSDSVAGGETVDTTAGSMTVFDPDGRASGAPIFPIQDVSPALPTLDQAADIERIINAHFKLDRILDMNGSGNMTARETAARMNIRAEAIRNPLKGFIKVIDKVGNVVINILFNKKRFGYMSDDEGAKEEGAFIIPKRIQNLIEEGRDFYALSYKSPAATMLKAGDNQNIMSALDVVLGMSEVFPEVRDHINPDATATEVITNFGADKILAGSDVVKETRERRKEQIQKQQQLEEASQELQVADQAQKVGIIEQQ